MHTEKPLESCTINERREEKCGTKKAGNTTLDIVATTATTSNSHTSHFKA
jgi:hypothetical protein